MFEMLIIVVQAFAHWKLKLLNFLMDSVLTLTLYVGQNIELRKGKVRLLVNQLISIRFPGTDHPPLP